MELHHDELVLRSITESVSCLLYIGTVQHFKQRKWTWISLWKRAYLFWNFIMLAIHSMDFCSSTSFAGWRRLLDAEWSPHSESHWGVDPRNLYIGNIDCSTTPDVHCFPVKIRRLVCTDDVTDFRAWVTLGALFTLLLLPRTHSLHVVSLVWSTQMMETWRRWIAIPMETCAVCRCSGTHPPEACV